MPDGREDLGLVNPGLVDRRPGGHDQAVCDGSAHLRHPVRAARVRPTAPGAEDASGLLHREEKERAGTLCRVLQVGALVSN